MSTRAFVREKIAARYDQVRHPAGGDRSEPVGYPKHFRRRAGQSGQGRVFAQPAANREANARPEIFLRLLQLLGGEGERDSRFGQARGITRGPVPVLQFVQIKFQRLFRPFDCRRLGEIERQNDRRFFLRQRLSHPVFVAVAEQDRLQFEFIGDPQGAKQIELVLRLEHGRVALRLLSQGRQACVRFGAFRRGRSFSDTPPAPPDTTTHRENFVG